MPESALIILGMVAGFGLGGLAGLVMGWIRARREFDARLMETNTRAATAEAALNEVRAQLEDGKKEEGRLRSDVAISESKRIEAETYLQTTLKSLEEQRALLADARQELSQAFKALADDALKGNTQAFLDLAKTVFGGVQAEAKGELVQRQQALEGLIGPLQETLKRYETHVLQLEQARQYAYGGLDEHLKVLAQSQERLQRETGNLVKALRSPQVRGQWGEITLKRVAELAGMVEHCDFAEQQSVEGETGRLRPDMIVQLPAGRQIVVDAKAVLGGYLEAMEAQDELFRQQSLQRHAAQIRSRVEQLGAKAYWSQFPEAPEFVVLFLPGEQFLGAALECDRTLLEDGFERRVIIATPTTLIALLRAVAYGWRQELLTENAQAISALGRDLFERMSVLVTHLEDVGGALGKAVSAYNKAVGSLEARVLPSVRKFRELGIGSDKDLPGLGALEQSPRTIYERPE